ncbi:hypothetical protein GWK47_026353 [Chionoecetes opilio]|uniref:Uncharacterized protein n=1 Tax=Chionoecetes opilio TaxID=41210 RepID=A0A8J8WE88_CHIOP|nr:hypothetical protein GWK47_026353 [Chionoecetes opilio]
MSDLLKAMEGHFCRRLYLRHHVRNPGPTPASDEVLQQINSDEGERGSTRPTATEPNNGRQTARLVAPSTTLQAPPPRQVIFAESLEVLVMALEALHEEAKPLGLEVSWLKTKVQVFGTY